MRIFSSPFFTLIKLQFKNKAALSFKANKFSLILKIFFYLILMAGITTGLYFLFDLFSKRSLFGLGVIPIFYFNVIFIFCFIIVLITSIIKFSEDLYSSPDNQFLITLPINLNKIFLSKIIVYYIRDLLRNMIIFIPIFFSYGIVNNFKIGYYFWVIFILLFILMIPVFIASLLSILIFKLNNYFKNNQLIRNIIIAILFITIFLFVIILFSLLPKELRLDEMWETVILPRLKNGSLLIEKIFFPISLLSMTIMGYKSSLDSPYRLSGFSINSAYLIPCLLLFLFICFLLTYFVVKKWFVKTITTSNEHKKEMKFLIYKTKEKHLTNYINVTSKNNKTVTNKELIEMIDNLYFNNDALFLKQNIIISDLLDKLQKENPNYSFNVCDYKDSSIALYKTRNSSHIVLVINKLKNKINYYDPYKFSVKNKKKSFILSTMYKDFIRDFRTSSYLSANLSVILFPSTLIFVLNKIFSGFKLNLLGTQLVFSLELFIVLLSLFIYTMRTSSLYSKDKKSSYILKVSPVNYSLSIAVKLFHEFAVGLISILLLTFNYYLSTPLTFINIPALFFTFLFLFLFNLLLCAEIDLRNIDKINNTAKTSEKAGEQNEMYSALGSIIFAFLISGISFVLVRYKSNISVLAIMTISFALLTINIILFPFISKIKRRKQ